MYFENTEPLKPMHDAPDKIGLTSSWPLRRTYVIRDPAEFEKLRNVWNSSSLEWASPMHQYEWSRACLRAIGTDGGLEIFVAEGQQGSAIAPLYRANKSGRLEVLGASMLHEPIDFLYAESTSLGLLATALVGSHYPLLLNRILADSPLLDTLKKAYRGRGILIIRNADACPWISLDESWRQPEKRLSPSRRSDIHRALRIAESMGRVEFEICSPDRAALTWLLEEVYQVEASGWKGSEGSALAYDTLRGEFYREYATAACDQGILRLCFLRIGGNTAAVQLAIESNKRFWILKIGYRDQYARCSPGNLLTMHTIRYAAESCLRSYEFLGTVEPWTRVWTNMERPCISVRAYPMSISGASVLLMDALRYAWKRTSIVFR